jgi:hypothetical protein
MAVDVGKITQGRQKDRDEVRKSGSDAVIALELHSIADTLEAIRLEMGAVAHITGSTAHQAVK